MSQKDKREGLHVHDLGSYQDVSFGVATEKNIPEQK